eukprot:2875712-Rhodomonas_salina.2
MESEDEAVDEAMLLRMRYAMSGTGVGYAATHALRRVWYWYRLCYAYATPCLVPVQNMLLPFPYTVRRWAMCDVGYGGTRGSSLRDAQY